jgi:hypothetical protein
VSAAAPKAAGRPELTAAVLLWVWDGILADADLEQNREQRIVKAAASELTRLGLIDALGSPTKEGRRLLGLI